MSIKNNFAIKFILFLTGLVALGIISLITIPPMINLNNMKPKIETAIFNKTGIKSEIHGNVNFSLLGHATIIAHNISVPNGVISDIEFTIPVRDIFNLENAKINNNITINGASLSIDKIVPFYINSTVNINDSKIKFLNKEYNIIHADISKNKIDAFVRTNQHKYEIKLNGNKFVIKNKNNDMDLSGELLPDGTAHGKINIIAQNVNRWFEFDTPYRVQNFTKCHGCFNDVRAEWVHVQHCPYHRGTDRAFECSRSISPQQVIMTIERLRHDLSNENK